MPTKQFMEKSIQRQLLIARFLFAIFATSLALIASTPFYMIILGLNSFVAEHTSHTFLFFTLGSLLLGTINRLISKSSLFSFPDFMSRWRKELLRVHGLEYLHKYGTHGVIFSMNVTLLAVIGVFSLVFIPVLKANLLAGFFMIFATLYEAWRDPLKTKDYKEITGQGGAIPVK